MPAYRRLTQLTAIPCGCRGFLSRPIPEAFLQQLRQQAVAAAGGGSGSQPAGDTEQVARGWQGGASGEEGEDAAAGHSEAAGEHESAAPGSKRRRPVFRVNQSVRQRWFFRRALVRTLLLLQQQATGTPALLLQQAASGKTAGRQARRRSSAAQQQQQQQQQVQWQPGFDPAAVTAVQLQAAGEQLSAPAREAAEAAEQEAADADALATARRLAGSSGSATPLHAGGKAGRGGGGSSKGGGTGIGAAAPTARQQGAARPPQLMKQYPPCTDTTQMGPRQFLEHLKQLPWYQGQVREGYASGVIAHARLFLCLCIQFQLAGCRWCRGRTAAAETGAAAANRQQKCHAGIASINDLDVLRCR